MAYEPNVPKNIVDAFADGENFLIAAHMGLDGDHLGSMLALGRALKLLGKTVSCYLPEEIPYSYQFLPDLDKLDTTIPDRKFDTLVTLECPNVARLPEGIDVEKAQRDGITVLNLDHHPDNENYGDHLWIEPDAGALGEMIFDLFRELNVKIDAEIATCLYTAIVTDTGSFQYSRVTAHTHLRLAELMKFNLPTDDISRRLFQETPKNVVKLLGSVLADVQVVGEGRLAYACIPLETMRKLDVDESETRFFIDDVDRVMGPKVVAVFRQISLEKVKVSLRSRGPAVNQVAAEFGGGGHAKAAGCVVDGELEAVRDRVVNAVIASLN